MAISGRGITISVIASICNESTSEHMLHNSQEIALFSTYNANLLRIYEDFCSREGVCCDNIELDPINWYIFFSIMGSIVLILLALCVIGGIHECYYRLKKKVKEKDKINVDIVEIKV